jgi:hypothetical protein
MVCRALSINLSIQPSARHANDLRAVLFIPESVTSNKAT